MPAEDPEREGVPPARHRRPDSGSRYLRVNLRTFALGRLQFFFDASQVGRISRRSRLAQLAHCDDSLILNLLGIDMACGNISAHWDATALPPLDCVLCALALATVRRDKRPQFTRSGVKPIVPVVRFALSLRQFGGRCAGQQFGTKRICGALCALNLAEPKNNRVAGFFPLQDGALVRFVNCRQLGFQLSAFFLQLLGIANVLALGVSLAELFGQLLQVLDGLTGVGQYRLDGLGVAVISASQRRRDFIKAFGPCDFAPPQSVKNTSACHVLTFLL